jgi:enoyl-CoA hydratase/carnithine racemase
VDDDLALRDDHGAVSVLTMNRPERLNAFNPQLAAAITGRLDELAADSDIRVVILTGSGSRAFCAGADLKDRRTHSVSSVEAHVTALTNRSAADFFVRLLNFSKPIICAVNGYAIGVGFQMQLCCDVILASTTAQFRLPQVALGIMPAYGGAPRLAQWVGRGKAAEIALSGRFVGALEAERIGLVASVHEPGELLTAALALATGMAKASPLSLAMTKESLRGALEDGPLRAASAADNYRFMALAMTGESTSRHQAWREGGSYQPKS